MGRAMLPDAGDQVAYESGNALADDRFEHVGLSNSVDPWESLPSLTAVAGSCHAAPTQNSRDEGLPVRVESKVRVPRELARGGVS